MVEKQNERSKMKVMFLEAPYEGKVELCSETLAYLKKKKYKKIGLYASAQFLKHLDHIKKQLKDDKITAVTSKPDRAHAGGQLLGCDAYENSLKLKKNEEKDLDCYLYVGDGRFHPLALIIAQKDKDLKEIKEVVCYDPLQKKMSIISFEDVKPTLKKYKAALMRFLSSRNIGVIISIKPGQEQFKASMELKKRYPAKKVYYFVDDNISFGQLENFPFIDEWVNTACPRIGFNEQENFFKRVINLNDALRAEEILSKNFV